MTSFIVRMVNVGLVSVLHPTSCQAPPAKPAVAPKASIVIMPLTPYYAEATKIFRVRCAVSFGVRMRKISVVGFRFSLVKSHALDPIMTPYMSTSRCGVEAFWIADQVYNCLRFDCTNTKTTLIVEDVSVATQH